MSGVSLKVDHVTLAAAELAPLEGAFAAAGLAADYGGPHANGVTHMALLGFNDGSYVELISSLVPGQTDPAFWGRHISGDGGPCAWAVEVADVAAEAARVASLGVPVKGPTYSSRRRPDGVLVEWHMAFLGDRGAGATLPFIIKDITPRQVRVQPSASVADGLLMGVAAVILGVADLEADAALFRHVYGWPAPWLSEDETFGARLAGFPGTPVVLAAPLAGQPWLADRLARFGPSPCAYLLETRDLAAACRRYALAEPVPWFGRSSSSKSRPSSSKGRPSSSKGRRVAWFEPARLRGSRLGVIGPAAE